MRGVAEGRGEPEYLHSKYSEMPTFLRKVGTPLYARQEPPSAVTRRTRLRAQRPRFARPPEGELPEGQERPPWGVSLEGEAFGKKFHLIPLPGKRRITDKASPLGEKLSSPGSSEPGDD